MESGGGASDRAKVRKRELIGAGRKIVASPRQPQLHSVRRNGGGNGAKEIQQLPPEAVVHQGGPASARSPAREALASSRGRGGQSARSRQRSQSEDSDSNAGAERVGRHPSEQRSQEESGRSQHQPLQGEALAAEARLRSEFSAREAEQRTEMEELKARMQREKEELLERLRKVDSERALREGERDESRAQMKDLEARLEAAYAQPEQNQARLRALEMELNLVRTRFANETSAKEAAQRVAKEAKEEKQRLQAALDRTSAEARRLRGTITQQEELINFRQEVANDLQAKLHEQKSEAERRLRRERGKVEAVKRLECVLPRELLMKALS